MNILECTANGAGACRNESMILDLTAERDAARADCATLHKMLDETVSERDAALRNYQNARIVYEVVIDERDVARAEADALREHVLRLRDACENVAQNMEASGKLWSPWHTEIAVTQLRDALKMTAGK